MKVLDLYILSLYGLYIHACFQQSVLQIHSLAVHVVLLASIHPQEHKEPKHTAMQFPTTITMETDTQCVSASSAGLT
jgi:hypothetical protein